MKKNKLIETLVFTVFAPIGILAVIIVICLALVKMVTVLKYANSQIKKIEYANDHCITKTITTCTEEINGWVVESSSTWSNP